MMVGFLKEFRYKISRFILIDISDQKGNQLPLDVIDYKVRKKVRSNVERKFTFPSFVHTHFVNHKLQVSMVIIFLQIG